MRTALLTTIALASSSVIVAELLAIRTIEMLAPVGVMLTGATIALALLGAAIGAAIGARIPRERQTGALGGFAALGALLIALLPSVGLSLGEALGLETFSPPPLLFGVVALLVMPIALALGTIFPLAVAGENGDARARIGRAAVAGAVGAVGGALAPELLDFVGDRMLALVAALSLLAAALVATRSRLVLAAAVIAALSPLAIARLPEGCDIATRYYACMAIVRPHADEPGLIELTVGRSGLISSFYLDRAAPARIYIGAAHALATSRVAPGSGRVATLGGGGLGFPRLWAPEGSTGVVTSQVAVEIDARMLELVEASAPASAIPGLEIVAGDARRWVTRQGDASHRLVFVDTFRTAEPAPGMLSRELASDLARITAGDGLAIYHVAGWGRHRIPRAASATLATAFPWVAAIRLLPPGTIAGDGSDSKWLIVASRTPLDDAAIEAIRPGRSGWRIEHYRSDAPGWREFLGDAVALSDDFAPLEWLTLLDTIDLNIRIVR